MLGSKSISISAGLNWVKFLVQLSVNLSKNYSLTRLISCLCEKEMSCVLPISNNHKFDKSNLFIQKNPTNLRNHMYS